MVTLEGALLDAEIHPMRPSTFASLGAALVLALPGLTAAQPAPPIPPPPPGSHENWDRPHEDREIGAHLQALHDRLAIRPDQEGAWRSAIAAMHPVHGPAGLEHALPPGASEHDREGMMDDMPLPERLARMQAMLDRHAAMMHERLSRMIEATRSLYAVLDPTQRHALDNLPGMMGHMAMMHGGMGAMGSHGMEGHMHPPMPPVPPQPPQG